MKVSLFVTCLIDQIYPEVGRAAVELLERLGVEVDYDPKQTCCGQPAFNTGYTDEARSFAEQNLKILNGADYVVIPSGSCASQFRVFYPELFQHSEEVMSLARKTYELSEFLIDLLKIETLPSRFEGVAAYHDSCHALRELGIQSAPRRLLQMVHNLKLVELPSHSCCGFGGTFSVKYPELSCAMADDKIRAIEETGANILISTDMGCLMHLKGRLEVQKSPIRVMHLAEVLVGED